MASQQWPPAAHVHVSAYGAAMASQQWLPAAHVHVSAYGAAMASQQWPPAAHVHVSAYGVGVACGAACAANSHRTQGVSAQDERALTHRHASIRVGFASGVCSSNA